MARFVYPFQRILDMKEKVTQDAQVNMAVAVQKQEKIEHRLNHLQHKIDALQKELEVKQQEGTSITELRMFESYVKQLQTTIKNEETQLFLAKKNVDKKQEVLREALKEEKTWHVIKEKKELEFVEKMKLIEEQQLNEISSQLYIRHMGIKG